MPRKNLLPGRARASPMKPARDRNRLLASLSPDDLGLLQPNLRPVALQLRQVLEKPNRRIENIYFMDAGITSVVAVQTGETRVEVGLIGCEGMSGTAVVLGALSSPHESYIQVAGEAQQIATGDLQKAMAASVSLHRKLLRYVQVFMVQMAHTAIANARARLDERLARWILMAHDRVSGDTLPLTHEFLALMLGVRRAGVTEAVHNLASRGLIEFGRGQIVVRDRKGIERHASNSYGVPEAEYRRLIG
jgi:CRP-like cAMP-binding protein